MSLDRISPYLAKTLGIPKESMYQCFLPASFADIDDLLDLRKALFEGKAPWNDRDYISWRYFSESNENNIWVFKKGNEILGCIGLEQVNLHINNELGTAHKAMDVLVKPELDGKGLGAWMNLALMEKYPTLFAVGSNEKSHNLVSRLFHPMANRQVWKLPINLNSTFRSKLKIGPLSDIVAFPFNIFLSIKQKFHFSSLSHDFSVKSLEKIPADVNSFQLRDNNQIYVHRTREYLNWRFVQNPRRKFIILGFYYKESLVGISFSWKYYSKANQQNEALIFDWHFTNSDLVRDMQGPLLQETVIYLKKQGVKLIQTFAYGDNSKDLLSKLGFIQFNENLTFFTFTKNSKLQKHLYDDKNWFLTEGDSDTDMF